MKALFINGSPRKNWNTHKMLEEAMHGAADAGAECELVHLYDLSFKGCMSCFACKLKGSKTNGLCVIRDSLRPVLEKALASDVIIMGSPVYFSYPTGMFRLFIERLLFPIMSYSINPDGTRPRAIDRTIYSGIIYTMNCTEDFAPKVHYPELLAPNADACERVLGYCETLCAYNTYQFADYSRYEANMFSEPDKAEYREKVFPEDLRKAHELGKRLAEKAAAQN
ncbi:MAG: flavodoxin family protein [Synergistaceae bacterium]|nr:flavodoxin family protein [Synergistaceae bacterium]